ncbi:MAG: N-methyl-L-tryptophan oxidase [Chthoniobacterales bacterium]|nr:N-methyl-L-tryptophan oxidase [Chthoniobacterales bacterium]
MTYDVAVVGLGGIGSAIFAHCAARGAKTIGLEQFGAAHDLGSSHGKSRMIRKAYFEDPAYVPLLLRAYDLWRELEKESGEELLTMTGLLMVGEESAPIVSGARHAASAHGLSLQVLTPREIQRRYPTLQLLPNEIGVFEPDGGVLAPERAIAAYLRAAARSGAEIRCESGVSGWEAKADAFEICLTSKARLTTKSLILAQGPWFSDALGVPLRVQRNVQAWFTPSTPAYAAGRFPPFLIERANFPAPLYGFPDFGDGIKAAFHAHGTIGEVGQLDREINQQRDIAPIIAAMEKWMPGATATFRAAKPCPYTLTPDGHFVIDRHPEHKRVILCGGFSGHGFKFAPVIGEIAADLALDGGSRHEIDFLSPRRFSGSPFAEKSLTH